MKFTHLILFFVILFLLFNCKSKNKADNKIKPYVSELNLEKDLVDFLTKMSEKDTIKIVTNLTMEYWVRIDEFELTKKNNKIQLKTTIKEDTTFELKYQMRINKLTNLIISNENNRFEKHFADRIDRIKGKNKYQWIYKIINQNDTLTFHTNGLGDKGGEVLKYFEFIRNYYPNEIEFKPANVY